MHIIHINIDLLFTLLMFPDQNVSEMVLLPFQTQKRNQNERTQPASFFAQISVGLPISASAPYHSWFYGTGRSDAIRYKRANETDTHRQNKSEAQPKYCTVERWPRKSSRR